MTWKDIPRNPSPRTLRQFAAAWLIFIGLSAVQQYRHHHQTAGLVLASIALLGGVAGLIQPVLLRRIFVTWMILAFPIGWFVSQVMLVLMYYIFLTPLALAFRLTGRDVLFRKPQSNRSTYWLAKEAPRDVRSYFRQH
jgi:hypothetical protein